MKYQSRKLKRILAISALISTTNIERILGADITPDSSLGSRVDQTSLNSYSVNGGLSSGSTLFHSFSKFNINNQENINFNNSLNIKNIFTRITGNGVSNLDGLISANGNSNLFLLNPNGFIFGRNFSLDIGGSFFASTANRALLNKSIDFTTDFVSLDSNSLSIDLSSINLFFGEPSGKILINGNGLELTPSPALGQIFIPTGNAGKSRTGFKVAEGQTIGVFGNGIEFNEGVLLAPSGQIAIVSTSDGEIELKLTNGQWNPSISIGTKLNNINLSNLSLLDVSGNTNGTIKLIGNNISFRDGAYLLSQSLLGFGTGELNILASGDLSITGASNNPVTYQFPQVSSFSGLISETIFGIGSNINIKANNILINDGAAIGTNVAVNGIGGNISVEANSLKVAGFPKNAPRSNPSTILTTNLNSGKTGNIFINVLDLSIENGATISNTGLNIAESGNISIMASNTINITGFNPFSNISSQITTSTVGSGNAGNLKVSTTNLLLSNNGFLGSRIVGNGSTGEVSIDVENISVIGNNSSNTLFTGIYSAAIAPDPLLANILSLPSIPQGNIKNLTIRASNINLSNAGLISTQNDGVGDGGTLEISANTLSLLNSNILASTKGGNGGNIVINPNILLLKDSTITSSANLSGNGGNTTILAKGIAGNLQSAITANADQGFGGNINIDTLALVFPLSNITATSQRGIAFDGSVNIKSVEFTRIDQAAKQPLLIGRSLPEICNTSINKRSFLITAADIPDDVDDLRESDSEFSKIPYSIDNKTGKKILDIGIQGWLKRADGKGVPIAFNNLAFGGSYLVNACRELSKNAAINN